MTFITKNKKYSHAPRVANKRKIPTIDPALLTRPAETPEVKVFVPLQSFAEMPLHSQLKRNLEIKGYTHPTEIQENAIPGLIQGRDMLGLAATGTGKTGAFLIPLVEQLVTDPTKTGMVVVPTRELAQQVLEEFKDLTRGMLYRSACFIGGTSVSRDISNALYKNHLIVGTPGRLIDLANRGALPLQSVSTLILDEFDRMLDMGFINDVKMIVNLTHNRKQTLLFSATMDKAQQPFIQQILSNPIEVKVNGSKQANTHVEQHTLKVGQHEDKFDVLMNLISGDSFKKVMLFAETKSTVDKINKQLARSGVKSDVIHGNKSQNYRSNAIHLFKTGKTRVLVATDVASRGIDVQDVTHVINYQLPQTMDAYIHRIGRTGRAGKKGIAYTFVN